MNNIVKKNFNHFSEAQASVPVASNKMGEWLIEWLSMQFFSWASSAVEAVKETKFGTNVVYGVRMMPELQIHA